jgi:DNA processing protein
VSIAVMAGGADVVYPRSAHEQLGRIAVSGAVVSEHAWGKEPLRWMFRTRNRIIAGLSVAVLVTEAAVGSGTFSTAEYADDAGRDVLVVPGSIFAPECAGANRLIRQGAIAITEVDDLRAALEPVLGPVKKDAIDEVASSFGVQGTETDPLLAAIVANPQRPDDLARGLGLDIVTVARRLGRLEADGRIERYRDGRYGIGR